MAAGADEASQHIYSLLAAEPPQRQPSFAVNFPRPGLMTLAETFKTSFGKARRATDGYLNFTVRYKLWRWLGAALLAALFVLRVYLARGYYMIAYFLYIYLLASFISFISPKEEEAEPLPIRADGEYRPIQRGLPEFEFWQQVAFSHLIAMLLSLLPFLNIPVYAPVLVVYCVVLTVVFVSRELSRWRSLAIDPKQAVRHWVGLDKPKYKTSG